MKRPTLLQIYAVVLCIIFGLIVIHAPLIVGIGTVFPDYAIIVKAWKEILMAAMLPVMVMLMWRTRRQQRWERQPLVWLIVGYVLLHLLSLSQWHGVAASLAGLAIDLRYVAYFAMVYVLIRVAPSYRHPMLKIGLVGAVIVIGFAVLQLVLPPDFLKVLGYNKQTIAPYGTVDQNYSYIRRISTLRGPNPLGAYAASTAIILLAWLIGHRVRDWRLVLLGVLALVATYVSFSRSAYLGLAVGVAIVLMAYFGKLRRFWVGSAVLGMVALMSAIVITAIHPEFLQNVAFHNNPHDTSAVNSDEGHASSLQTGMTRMVAQPFGAGIGSTGSASLFDENSSLIIENQYLMVAHEVGWLGLGVFIVINAVILRKLWLLRRDPLALDVFGAGICLAIIGLFLPVWADDTISIVWWGLAAIVCASATRPATAHLLK